MNKMINKIKTNFDKTGASFGTVNFESENNISYCPVDGRENGVVVYIYNDKETIDKIEKGIGIKKGYKTFRRDSKVVGLGTCYEVFMYKN